MTGGGNCTRDSQGPRNPYNINNQTFTKNNKKTFFIEKALELCQKNAIFRAISKSFFKLRFLLNKSKLNKAPQNFTIENPVSGYVLILMTALIPVLLFGTKYLLDLRTLHKVQLEKENGGWYKRCAKEAALAVAKKWNTGLTLFQQRDAMYKIADDVYNSSPLTNDSIVARAIPRLDLSGKTTVKNTGSFDPIQVKSSDYQSRILDKSLRTVEYKEEIDNYVRSYGGGCNNTAYGGFIFSLFNTIYNFDNRDSALVLEDTVFNYAVTGGGGTIVNRVRPVTRTSNRLLIRNSNISYRGIGDSIGSDTNTPKVNKRKSLDDDKVKIEIEGDKIKVTTDGNYVGYAVPAECNVDIVLGIPVNGAASNKDNLDNNTPTAGVPHTQNYNRPMADGLKTPISQIGQAFHDFVRDNFHHTRGVNIGIVPYCGMVSLPLDRVDPECAADPSKIWAVDPENFNRTVFQGNQNCPAPL